MTDEIRTDTSPEAMRRAIEDKTVDRWRLMATSGVIWIEETDDLITVGTVEKPSAFRDSVLRTRFPEIDAEQRIEATLAGLGWPRAGLIWWQPPSSTPADMRERLLRRGFQPRNDFPNMAIEIERLRPDKPRPRLEIEVVRDRERMVVASETMAAASRPLRRSSASSTRCTAASASTIRDSAFTWGCWTVRRAGTTILVTGGGVADIYGVAVRPEARRRGVAGALTMSALVDAAAMECQIGTLGASDMGQPVYEPLGLETYCTIPQYGWNPPE